MGSATNARQLAVKRLKESGLSEKDGKALHMEYIADASKLNAGFYKVPAIKIPYFESSGKVNCFYRIRYLGTPVGFQSQVKKPQRYTQEPGVMGGLYMPPLMKQKWKALQADAKSPILITEGEIKAAAACKAGIACVALGGVDSWRSVKRNIPLLPDLAAFQWQERRVYIAYDSDAESNPSVRRAEISLCRKLSSLGALPLIIRLPALGDTKMGLDDWLVAEGAPYIMSLVQKAKPDNTAKALHQLNKEVIFVRSPPLVVVMADGQEVAPEKFVSSLYANRLHIETVIKADGTPKFEEVSTARAWLKWEGRNEATRLDYEPGQHQMTEAGGWNKWKGWGCEPEAGSCAPWDALLDHFFKGDKVHRRWFEQWCAWPLQNPGGKLFTSVLMWGSQHGTGKSLFGYTMGRIYGANFAEIGDADLRSQFNEWAVAKQFVLGEEITGTDKRAESDRLKGFISRQICRVNAKFVPSYEIPDRINYYFTSNHPDALFLEDTDRRQFVWEAPAKPLPMSFYKDYERWLKGSGPSHLFARLLKMDLGDFEPAAAAPVTNAKRAMMLDSKSDLGSWVARLREDPHGALMVLGEKPASSLQLASAGQLLRCYDPEGGGRATANGLGREMKRAGFRQALGGNTVGTSCGPQRLYFVRGEQGWDHHQCADHWNSFFGPKQPKHSGKKK